MIASIATFVTYKIKVDEFRDQIVTRKCNVTNCILLSPTKNGKVGYNISFSYHAYASTDLWYPNNITTPDQNLCPLTIICYYNRDHSLNSDTILSLSIIEPPDNIIFVYHMAIICIPICGLASMLCVIVILVIHKRLRDFMRY